MSLRLMFRSLEHRNFRLFFMGQGISLIGTWMRPSMSYSTGSSVVISFMSMVLSSWRAEYSVVVLPEPVGPVTSTMP